MQDKKRICHVITKLELGGAQQNTLYTVRHLDRQRYRTFLVSGRGGYLDEEVKRDANIRAFFLSSLIRQVHPCKDFLAFWKLWTLFRKESPHVVHTHSSKAGILGRWAAYLENFRLWIANCGIFNWKPGMGNRRYIKIIHTFHGFGFNDFQPRLIKNLFIWMEKVTARITHRLIFVSRENIQRAEENRIGRKEQFVLIRSGIKINEFRASVDKEKKKRELGLTGSPVVGLSLIHM